MKIGISACLFGDKVRYDQTDKRNDTIIELLKGHEVIKICPEVSSGFSLPHESLEIKDDKVYTKSGIDVTEQLYKGSRKCFDQIKDCDFVILKAKSPSCGYGLIYDGSFKGILIKGNGVFTGLCLENGIEVFNELQIEEIRKRLSQTDSDR